MKESTRATRAISTKKVPTPSTQAILTKNERQALNSRNYRLRQKTKKLEQRRQGALRGRRFRARRKMEAEAAKEALAAKMTTLGTGQNAPPLVSSPQRLLASPDAFDGTQFRNESALKVVETFMQGQTASRIACIEAFKTVSTNLSEANTQNSEANARCSEANIRNTAAATQLAEHVQENERRDSEQGYNLLMALLSPNSRNLGVAQDGESFQNSASLVPQSPPVFHQAPFGRPGGTASTPPLFPIPDRRTEHSTSTMLPSSTGIAFGSPPAQLASALPSSGQTVSEPKFTFGPFGLPPKSASPKFGPVAFGASQVSSNPSFGSPSLEHLGTKSLFAPCGLPPKSGSPKFSPAAFGASGVTSPPSFGSSSSEHISALKLPPKFGSPKFGSPKFGRAAFGSPSFESKEFAHGTVHSAPTFGFPTAATNDWGKDGDEPTNPAKKAGTYKRGKQRVDDATTNPRKKMKIEKKM